MTAALKTQIPAQDRARDSQRSLGREAGSTPLPRTRRQRQSEPVSFPGPVSTTASPRHLQALPEPFPKSRRTQVLSLLNMGLSTLTGLLVMIALGAYGYTVYIDRQLDQASARLAHLQRSEQQLTTVNEVLKNHMAKQAERPNFGLQPPQPTNVIFLKPAQKRTNPQVASVPAATKPLKPLAPLGY